eukprot:s2442_g20.t1
MGAEEFSASNPKRMHRIFILLCQFVVLKRVVPISYRHADPLRPQPKPVTTNKGGSQWLPVPGLRISLVVI